MHGSCQAHLHMKVIQGKKRKNLSANLASTCQFEELFWTVEISIELTPSRRTKLTDSVASIDNLKKKVYNTKSEGNGVFRHYVGCIVPIFVLGENLI